MAGPLDNSSSFWHAKAAIAKNFANRKPAVDSGTRDSLCPIAHGLYLSSCHLEAQKELLKHKGVTHVLQVGKELSPTHPAAFTYKHVPVYDLEEEDLVKYFPECFRFIEAGREAGGVLVHCAAGISRSASVVIGYLMSSGGLTLEDARRAVKAARPAINPNQGFLLQLHLFQEAGCSVEGWQQWDLAAFLKVRSAAYSRSDVGASMSAAAAENSGSLMRGACELAPPVLSREDSVSPIGSPTQSAGRGGDSHDFLLPPTAGISSNSNTGVDEELVGLSALPSRRARIIGGGHGGQWGTVGAADLASSQGPGAGRAANALPALPAVGGAATGAAAAAAAAAWAGLLAASGGEVAADAHWRSRAGQAQPPPPPAAATAPYVAPAAAAGGWSKPLSFFRSLQRQRSAGDAVVSVAVEFAPGRSAAQSVPSLGADPTATSAGATVPSTTAGTFPRSFNGGNGGCVVTGDPSMGPTMFRHTGDVARLSSTAVGPVLRPMGLGAAPVRARTTSGIADAGAMAAWAAAQAQERARAWAPTHGSMPSQPEGSRISGTFYAQACPDVGKAAGEALTGSDSASLEAPAARAAGSFSWLQPPQSGTEWSRGRGSGSVLGAVGRASMQVAGRASYSGGYVSDGPAAATVILPDPRAHWPQPPALPPAAAPAASQQLLRWSLQPSLEAGAPPALSPIHSDGGCSDEACRSEPDDGGAFAAVAGAVGRFGGSARQLHVGDELSSALLPAYGGARHGPLRRSVSDRLQGMQARAFTGMATAPGKGAGGATGLGACETLGAGGSSQASALRVGPPAGQELGGGLIEESAGGQVEGFLGSPPAGPWLYGGPGAAVSAAASSAVLPAAAPRMSTDSGASSGAAAAVWHDGSGSDGSSNSTSTATSRTSAAGGAGSGGGAAAAEERSDATSGTASAACSGPGHPVAGGAGRYDNLAPGAVPPTDGAPPSPASPDDAAGHLTLGHRQRWTFLPILTPAGLERTPSRAPLALPTAALAAAATADTASALAPEGAAERLREWPEASSLADGGSAAAARSAALSHLVAAQALSHGGAAAGIAHVPMTPHVRSDPEIATSRTVSVVSSAAASPRGPPPAPFTVDSSKQGPHQAGHQADAAGGAASALLPMVAAHFAGGRAAAAAAGGGFCAKAASRLSTATFAHPAGAANSGHSGGLTAAGGRRRRECSRSSSGSGGGAVAAATAGSDKGGGSSSSDTDGESASYGLQRCSAPSAVTSDVLAAVEGMAAAAALPPADSMTSPPPLPPAPVRSLRLSIRSLHGPAGGGAAAATAAAATDAGRPEGGTGTPIHKRVMRSLTSFLSRSPESPTTTAAAATATTTSVPEGHGGIAEAAGGGCRGGARAALGGRTAAVLRAGDAHGGGGGGGGGEGAAALRRQLWGGWSSRSAHRLPSGAQAGARGGGGATTATTAAADDDEVGVRPVDPFALVGRYLLADEEAEGAAAAAQPAGTERGSVARASVLLPAAASSLPGDQTRAPANANANDDASPPPPSATGSGLTLRAPGAGAHGRDAVDLTSTWDGVDWNDALPGAGGGGGRALFRSRSSSPTCAAVVVTGGPFAWPAGGADGALLRLGPGPGPEDAGTGTGAGAAVGWEGAPTATWRRADGAPAVREEEEGEGVVGVYALPEAPFRWGAGTGADGLQELGVAVATAPVAAAATDAGAEATAAVTLHRGNPRQFSLDGRGYGGGAEAIEQLSAVRHAGRVTAAGYAAAAATAASAAYTASWASVAGAAMLPAHSGVMQGDSTPLDNAAVATGEAPAAPDAIASAPASATVAASAVWWRAPAATAAATTGSAAGAMQRAVSVGEQGIPLPSPSNAAHNRRSEGLALLGLGGVGADWTTHGSAAAPAHEPAGPPPAATCSHAQDRRPRSSYSGSLSMVSSAGHHGLAAWAGVGAGAGASAGTGPAGGAFPGGAPPQWRHHPPGADPQLLMQPRHPPPPPPPCSGVLAPSPMSSPLPHELHEYAALYEQQQQQQGAMAGQPTGSGGTTGGGVTLPAWGGSRSSACLMTMPSDPEPQEHGTAGRPPQRNPAPDPDDHKAAPGTRQPQPQLHQQTATPQQQQQQLLRQWLDGLGPGQGSTPSSHRATVRSSSAGSSAAATHTAAASVGSLAADSTTSWDPLRTAHQHLLQQHQHLPPLLTLGDGSGAAERPGTVPPLRLSATADGADPRVTLSPVWSRSAATEPLLESPSGALPLALARPALPAHAVTLDAPATRVAPTAGSPVAAPPSASAAPGRAGAPSATSPSAAAAAAAAMTVRMPISPTASSGGSCTSVHSPRAPPVVSDIPELDPSDPDWLDGGGAGSVAAATLPVVMVPWRVSDATAAAAAMAVPPAPAGAAAHGGVRGQLDASLLNPVLGRRLLPMPSPSRIIIGSPAGTPRGSAGGVGAPASVPVPSITASPPHPTKPQRSAPGHVVAATPEAAKADAAAARAPSRLSVPGPGHQVPEPWPAAHVADLRVLLPHELPTAGDASSGRGGGGSGGGGAAAVPAQGVSSSSPVSPASAGREAGGRGSSGGGAAAARSGGGGAQDGPSGSPQGRSNPGVRLPSAMCGSQSNSDDGGPGDMAGAT